MGIGDWGLGPIPNPQSPIPKNSKNVKLTISYYLLTLSIYIKNFFNIFNIFIF